MESLALRQALLQTSLCRYLDLHEVDMLMGFSKVETFAEGDVLLQQGHVSDGIYIIVKGKAEVTAQVLGVGSHKMTELLRGNFIGEISLIQQTSNTTSVVAVTPMQCLFIVKTYFETLATFFPETKFKISKVITEEICRRLNDVREKIVAYMTQSHMVVAQSFFGEFMQSFSREVETTLGESHISKAYLKRQEIFDDFNEDEFDYLLAHSVITDAPTKCTLIKENEKNEVVYFVIRGAVQSSIVYQNIVAKLSVLGPITIFGCMSCVGLTASIINFSTCEHAILLKVSKNSLEQMQKEKPRVWYKVYDLISKSQAGLEQAANKLEVRMHSELYNR